MGSVINLHGDLGPWGPYERAVLVAIRREFSTQGIESEWEDGRAEDGTPWTAFYAVGSGHFVAHVAAPGTQLHSDVVGSHVCSNPRHGTACQRRPSGRLLSRARKRNLIFGSSRPQASTALAVLTWNETLSELCS
jgi:hypothetical protein